MDPVKISTYVSDVGSGDTYKNLVIEAISTFDDHGDGVEIEAISEFIKERKRAVRTKFMKKLRVMLNKLVSQNILAMVENRYKILNVAEEDSTNSSWTVEGETAKAIAEADNKELEAEEAVEAWKRANELLERSVTMFELANEIVEQCVQGKEVYLL
ncbi:unnamed protein product [Cochlearia groenlandica]